MALPPDQPDYSVPSLGPISKESRLEWRSRIGNDNGIVDGTIPPNFLTGAALRGKFFPRGCRGKIERLEIYCRRAVVGTLELSISPQPGMGPTYTVPITPAGAWAWQSADLRQFWNYDSLFIWVSACEFDVSYAYDEVRPYDAHNTLVVPVAWWRQNRRYFIRVVCDSETAGDVPVSGTINNVAIPNSASGGTDLYDLNVPKNGELFHEVEGAGTLLMAIWEIDNDQSLTYLQLKILADGVEALPLQRLMSTWYNTVHGGVAAHSGQGIYITNWDATTPEYIAMCILPIQFKRSIQVGFANIDGVVAHLGRVAFSVNLLR